jgi:hypothetical protein
MNISNFNKTRDKIVYDWTRYVVGCARTGEVYSEHPTKQNAKQDMHGCGLTAKEGYAVYSRDEWNEGVVK